MLILSGSLWLVTANIAIYSLVQHSDYTWFHLSWPELVHLPWMKGVKGFLWTNPKVLFIFPPSFFLIPCLKLWIGSDSLGGQGLFWNFPTAHWAYSLFSPASTSNCITYFKKRAFTYQRRQTTGFGGHNPARYHLFRGWGRALCVPLRSFSYGHILRNPPLKLFFLFPQTTH